MARAGQKEAVPFLHPLGLPGPRQRQHAARTDDRADPFRSGGTQRASVFADAAQSDDGHLAQAGVIRQPGVILDQLQQTGGAAGAAWSMTASAKAA